MYCLPQINIRKYTLLLKKERQLIDQPLADAHFSNLFLQGTHMNEIKFSSEEKQQIVLKVKSYFSNELNQDIGGFDAEFLIDFFAQEIGSYFYNLINSVGWTASPTGSF